MQDVNHHDDVNIDKFMFSDKVLHWVYSLNIALNICFKAWILFLTFDLSQYTLMCLSFLDCLQIITLIQWNMIYSALLFIFDSRNNNLLLIVDYKFDNDRKTLSSIIIHTANMKLSSS